MKTGVYIHIPFCKSKCLYCDFLSFSGKENFHEAYKNALVMEINKHEFLQGKPIDTIFIGGGTPTTLPSHYLGEILEAIYKQAKVSNKAEITVEANPGTLSKEMLCSLKKSGVNRLSVGLQAWQEPLLKTIGRRHSVNDFIRNYDEAVTAGFENINVDLMFSLPGQTLADWDETLRNILRIIPKHISAYSLIIEEKTPFGELYAKGELTDIDEDLDRKMYSMAKDYLKADGYDHYEISNFSKNGYESKHNSLYWSRDEYIGLGLNAHSFYSEHRSANTDDLEKYIDALGDQKLIKTSSEKLGEKEAMEEFMFLGLRVLKGVDIQEFKDIFHKDIDTVFGKSIKEYVDSGFLEFSGKRLALTEKGIDVSNIIFTNFLL